MDYPTREPARRLRVGAVSYLNTKPLVERLPALAPEVDLSFDLPSRLAADLSAGRLDVALIPSIAYLQDPGYAIVSDACIACRGPVLSVKLLSRKPLPQIRTLALDEGSQTSAALAQVLLYARYRLKPELMPLAIGANPLDCPADAVLLIGDRAIHTRAEAAFPAQWDLGEEWCRSSDLPFVFAMWVARGETDLRGLDAALEQARDFGVAHVEEIARREAVAVGLEPDQTLTYLRDHLHFYLGPREHHGLALFFRQAAELGLIPTGTRTAPAAS
jgi:chorismate dehydratase